jgi:hypothetical protein
MANYITLLFGILALSTPFGEKSFSAEKVNIIIDETRCCGGIEVGLHLIVGIVRSKNVFSHLTNFPQIVNGEGDIYCIGIKPRTEPLFKTVMFCIKTRESLKELSQHVVNCLKWFSGEVGVNSNTARLICSIERTKIVHLEHRVAPFDLSAPIITYGV